MKVAVSRLLYEGYCMKRDPHPKKEKQSWFSVQVVNEHVRNKKSEILCVHDINESKTRTKVHKKSQGFGLCNSNRTSGTYSSATTQRMSRIYMYCVYLRKTKVKMKFVTIHYCAQELQAQEAHLSVIIFNCLL